MAKARKPKIISSANVVLLPTARLLRPRPPANLVSMGGLANPDRFVPAPELVEWIKSAYLADDGPLFNRDHSHLNGAVIGALWTNTDNTRQMRRVIGQAEMPARSLTKNGAWQRARQEQQMRDWFGGEVPDFVLTFDALHADICDDAAFCALVDHELYHCAQQEDEFGMPKFNQATGEPSFTIRGHDIEEFVGVVRRFGIEAAGEQAVDMVIAAAQRPEIAPAKLSQACGTCLRQVA